MPYQRFRIPKTPASAATVANLATVTAPAPPNIAIVASVAGAEPEPEIWDAEDWLAFYEERAAIAEFDGGLSRADAEALAYKACVQEWQEEIVGDCYLGGVNWKLG